MTYSTPDVPLDLFAEPRHHEIEIGSITEKAVRHLIEMRHWISLRHFNADNYRQLISEIIPTTIVCGLYVIFRIDPLMQNVLFCYGGSSCSVDSGVNSRFRKYCRCLFCHNLSSDRDLAYVDKFAEKFGRNLDDTFVCFYELPYNIRKIPHAEFDKIEINVRKIEDNLISALKREYGVGVCVNTNKPVSSKLSETKRRQRAQNDVIHTLPFE